MKYTTLILLSLGAALCVEAQTAVDAGRQLYRANCQACHGAEGDTVAGVDFKSGQFRRASSDDDLVRLILNGIPGTAMPPTNLPEDLRRTLVAYLRSMHPASTGSSVAGDAQRGMAIFEGTGGCLNCHRAGGKGSRVGPDLSDVGSRRQAAALEQSIVAPHDVILPQNRFVRIVMKDGSVLTGRRLNEDTYTIELIDQNERLISVSRDDVREYTLLKTSTMPSYRGKLNPQEIGDLVAYLLSLKGVQ
ncbi:MAG TPA: c-type cytochrome [Bryobacteraceae bacterium]|nr:c-type cytochrome [Bryobacteraceae bacterium]